MRTWPIRNYSSVELSWGVLRSCWEVVEDTVSKYHHSVWTLTVESMTILYLQIILPCTHTHSHLPHTRTSRLSLIHFPILRSPIPTLHRVCERLSPPSDYVSLWSIKPNLTRREQREIPVVCPWMFEKRREVPVPWQDRTKHLSLFEVDTCVGV